jgi:hypothetical protein
MQLVEQTIIRKGDPRYEAIDAAAFASKNLYNQATYQIRQAFVNEGKYLPYAEIFHRLKTHEAYCALPRKVSNSILIQIDKNWKAFFAALAEWREHPEKFLGRPRLPGYKHKEKGHNILETRKDKPTFSGKREKRGLYRAKNGRRIHADINGSYNVLRKAFPDSFGQGIEALAVAPGRLAV